MMPGPNSPVLLVLVSGGATDVGLSRDINEDRYLVRADLGLWAVADGMGGHHNGDLAASTVVRLLETVGRAVSAPDLLARFEDRILRSNREIREIAAAMEVAVMGSTVAALLVFEDIYACVWSGDSRVYVLRDGTLRQLTRDHSELQERLDSGAIDAAAAALWPGRNVITHAIGVEDEPVIDLDQGRIVPGDTFLICTDGLTTHLRDEEIAAIMMRDEPQAACDNLIALALERGARDNVTVVICGERGSVAGGA